MDTIIFSAVPDGKIEEVPHTTLGRMITLSDKMRRRMYDHHLRQLQYVQVCAQETLKSHTFAVNLVSHLKIIY